MISVCVRLEVVRLLKLCTVIAEIEERHRFLEEMEALGQRKQYEAQVKAEISQVYNHLLCAGAHW